MEFVVNLWKVALYNLESIDGFYLVILGSRFRATVIFIQKPNLLYSDLELSKLGMGVLFSFEYAMT